MRWARRSIRGSRFVPRIAEQPEVEADDATHADRGFDRRAQPAFHLKELLDPSIVWTPKEAGEYLLSIADMRSLGDATSVYRVEVEPVHDAVHTYLSAPVIDSVECPRLIGLVIPRGNRWTFNLSLGEVPGEPLQGRVGHRRPGAARGHAR